MLPDRATVKSIVAAILTLGAVAGLSSLWWLYARSLAFDFSTFYTAGMLATTPDAPAVFDRRPGDLSRMPTDGAFARAANDAGCPNLPGQYFNLPVVMLLFAPLTWIDFETAFRIVTILNIVSLIGLAWLIVRLTTSRVHEAAGESRPTPRAPQRPGNRPLAPAFEPVSDSAAPDSSRRKDEGTRSTANLLSATATLIILAAISHPVCHNVALGNISIPLTLAVVAAFALDRCDRGAIGGVLLGVATIIKPAPALLLIFFVLRRRWAITIATVATVLVLLAVGLLYYGPQMHLRWLEIIRWNGSQTFVAWNNQSLLAAMLRFAVPPDEIALWDVHVAPSWMIWTQRALLVAGVAWWATAILRDRRCLHDDSYFAAGMILMTLALPFAWTHYFIVLLWPTAIVAARLLRSGRRDVLDWALLAAITIAWMANPHELFKIAMGWRRTPYIGPLAPRLLASHMFAAGVVLLIWLLAGARKADDAHRDGVAMRASAHASGD